MSVCPRCHRRYGAGEERCRACRAPLLDMVTGGSDGPESGRLEDGARFILLVEEPLYEMASMIREFLQNCGIGVLVHSEPIGLLYRLPAPGAPISRSRVYVHESDFQEARELVAHFFHRA